MPTKPLNEQKVRDGFKNLTFDMVKNYNTHVMEEHVNLNEVDNLDMVLSGRKQTQGHFVNAGKKTNTNMFVQKLIELAIKQKQEDVISWMKESENMKSTEFSLTVRGKLIGKVFKKEDGNNNRISEYDTSAMRIVIQRNDSMPLGFSLLTAYPTLDTKYKERTNRDISELVRKTNTFKNADDIEKVYHLYRTNPDSTMSVHLFDDCYTGEKKVLTIINQQDLNLTHKIRTSKDDCILNTYHSEYIGTFDTPYVQKIKTYYSRASNGNDSQSKDADLNKPQVFTLFERDYPQEAKEVTYIQNLMQNIDFIPGIGFNIGEEDDHDNRD